MRASRCPTEDYQAHETLVHEAGHAIGISPFDNDDIDDDDADRTYKEAHPFPRDSVYSVMVSRIPPAGQTLAPAHSCSPHPLDIMAIYAMYKSK